MATRGERLEGTEGADGEEGEGGRGCSEEQWEEVKQTH